MQREELEPPPSLCAQFRPRCGELGAFPNFPLSWDPCVAHEHLQPDSLLPVLFDTVLAVLVKAERQKLSPVTCKLRHCGNDYDCPAQ